MKKNVCAMASQPYKTATCSNAGMPPPPTVQNFKDNTKILAKQMGLSQACEKCAPQSSEFAASASMSVAFGLGSASAQASGSSLDDESRKKGAARCL